MGDKKPFVDSIELVMCQTFSQCASFPYSVQLSLSPTGKPNEGAERTENVIVGGEQSLELKNTISSLTISLTSSFKIILAMRGGQKWNGLGPRPKLSVKWAACV